MTCVTPFFRSRPLFFGKHQRAYEVGQYAAAPAEHQHDSHQADNGGIHLQVFRNTAAYTGQLLVGAALVQPGFRSSFLLFFSAFLIICVVNSFCFACLRIRRRMTLLAMSTLMNKADTTSRRITWSGCSMYVVSIICIIAYRFITCRLSLLHFSFSPPVLLRRGW